MENSGCDQPCKSCSKDVAGVEDCNTSGNLLAVVEDTEKVDSTRVVGCFSHTEEAEI